MATTTTENAATIENTETIENAATIENISNRAAELDRQTVAIQVSNFSLPLSKYCNSCGYETEQVICNNCIKTDKKQKIRRIIFTSSVLLGLGLIVPFVDILISISASLTIGSIASMIYINIIT
jgi:hypothetical protein